MRNYKKNSVVEGIVSNITSYGAFVYVDPDTSGLIHISEMSHHFVADISSLLTVGQRVYARVLDVDPEKGQLKLSLKHVSKRARPFFQNRKVARKKALDLLPPMRLGFLSLKEMLPKWVKEFKHDKG